MNFVVSKNFKGSFVSKTLKRVLVAGSSFSLSESDLSKQDIKMAIKRGIFISMDEHMENNNMETSDKCVVFNTTDKILIIDKISIMPWGSTLTDKSKTKSKQFVSAQQKGLICIISDEDNTIERIDYPDEKNIDDKSETTDVNCPIVWDFLNQKAETPVFINKAKEQTNVEVEDPEEKVEVLEVTQVKKAEDKIIKKGRGRKKKEIKVAEKGEDNVATEMDSFGKPVKKLSDEVQHLINSLNSVKDIDFLKD